MVRITYPGVYIEEITAGVHSIAGVATSTAAFVRPITAGRVDQPIDITALVEFDREFGPVPETDPMRMALRLFFDNGGSRAVVVGLDAEAAPETIATGGLAALDDSERFDLLCLPGLYAGGPPTSMPAVAAALEAASGYCQARGAILLIDPLPEWGSAADVVAGLAAIQAAAPNLRGENAAVFFPNLLVGTSARPMPAAPAGAIAGVIARTDRTRGIWKSAAGADATIAGAVGLATAINTPGASTIANAGVNTIRQFPGQGIVIWGARLLASRSQPDPEWKYIAIRRLQLFLERSIDEGLGWVTFEPNDEPLWADVRGAVDGFLYSLWRQGAFVGRAPHEAYFVKCDRDTMTQADIDNGILCILIGFAPLRPSEFVTVRIERHLN
jgi:phage tail sheath protein FI